MNTVNGIDIEAPVEVELEIRPDKSCNNEKKLEGESDANPH
jgi:hypothetical protein